MDKLSYYIKNGKKISLKKLCLVFFLIGTGIAGIAGAFLGYMLYRPELQNFIKDIPLVEIENGVVQKPENTVWEKDFPDSSAFFRIDTTKDEVQEKLENGAVLTRQKFYLFFRGNEQVSELPKEKIVIGKRLISKALLQGIINLSLVLGGTIFLFLFLGYIGTCFIVKIALRCFQKKFEKEGVGRASLIGWISVAVLNFLLTLFGYGFQISVAILLSSLIALFCVFQVGKES